VLDNPTSFSNPFQFEITFEAISELTEDLEWKVTYVGSAEDSSLDQVLDEVAVGPIPVGVNKFVLQADAPDVSRIQERDVLGVTVVLITCSYMEQEFCRVGYYVNNDYSDPIDLEVGVPSPIDMTKVSA
jgi:histone chaperone ASF1